MPLLYYVFLDDIISSGWLAHEVSTTKTLIAPYVAKDPIAFYTYEEFEKGCTTLNAYCTLRAESITKQLDTTIPAEGQALDSSNFVDASSLDLSTMVYMSDAPFFKLLSTDNTTFVHNFDSLKTIVGIQEETSSHLTSIKKAVLEYFISSKAIF
ncbi:hypothetical protein [Cellulosilyticum ruminicola]|uniref:hypothetical protein n=1 Tax=Cellulosilyticum ruminicola TaxID=425254 RepID=UPI0006D27D5C|nr:hypothetical protein [Cellulosilyticum ruminicola]